jgi:hypothetical protein
MSQQGTNQAIRMAAHVERVVRRTLASPKAQEQLLRMALLVLIWIWSFSIRLVSRGVGTAVVMHRKWMLQEGRVMKERQRQMRRDNSRAAFLFHRALPNHAPPPIRARPQFSVLRYESVIHEFDPYFNYRSTIKLVQEGFHEFWVSLKPQPGGQLEPAGASSVRLCCSTPATEDYVPPDSTNPPELV